MTDITELAQMKGQKVEGSYYLAECTDCGKMYPSNKLNGGEPLFSGDYGECYCPHCNADDAAIGDCGDTAAKAWNYQQDRIDALVEALEKAQQLATQQGNIACALFDEVTAQRQRISELEESHAQVIQSRDHYKRMSEEGLKKLAESRTVTVKLPEVERPIDGTGYAKAAGAQYYKECVIKALTAQGIKWEAE
ncbi:TPA: hypothetical protein MI733_000708 [Klebsiella aerogenes]|nr:hypothetical protein [Klebsiella aerogenes]